MANIFSHIPIVIYYDHQFLDLLQPFCFCPICAAGHFLHILSICIQGLISLLFVPVRISWAPRRQPLIGILFALCSSCSRIIVVRCFCRVLFRSVFLHTGITPFGDLLHLCTLFVVFPRAASICYLFLDIFVVYTIPISTDCVSESVLTLISFYLSSSPFLN